LRLDKTGVLGWYLFVTVFLLFDFDHYNEVKQCEKLHCFIRIDCFADTNYTVAVNSTDGTTVLHTTSIQFKTLPDPTASAASGVPGHAL